MPESTVKYPPGSPEYEAYAKRLREELLKWTNHEGEYVNNDWFSAVLKVKGLGE